MTNEVAVMTVTSELRAVLDSLDEPRLIIRSDFTVAYANQAFVRRYGRSDFAGRLCHELLFHSTERCSGCTEGCPLEWASVSGQTEEVLRRELTPGGVRFLELQCTPLIKADGQAALFMETIRDRSGGHALVSSGGVVAVSSAVQHLLGRIARVASLDHPVLLYGPVGCGKEEFARLIHENSRRAAHSFLPLECVSLTSLSLGKELLKSAGSGLSGGTLFLNDIADLSEDMQLALLKLLETGRFSMPGDSHVEKADIRIVCGTRRSPQELIDSGLLREDLYYRLVACALRVPSLEERREDIPELTRRMLKEIHFSGRHVCISEAPENALTRRRWRGNLRELRAVLERASIFCSGVIEPEDIDETPERDAERRVPADGEAERIRRAVRDWKGSRADLAEHLGISVRTLYRLIRKYGAGS